jgi:hypothetical protein
LAAASSQGILNKEELAGEFLAPLTSPQVGQNLDFQRGSVSEPHWFFVGLDPGKNVNADPDTVLFRIQVIEKCSGSFKNI